MELIKPPCLRPTSVEVLEPCSAVGTAAAPRPDPRPRVNPGYLNSCGIAKAVAAAAAPGPPCKAAQISPPVKTCLPRDASSLVPIFFNSLA